LIPTPEVLTSDLNLMPHALAGAIFDAARCLPQTSMINLPAEPQASTHGTEHMARKPTGRKRGRPPGSKNKSTQEKPALEDEAGVTSAVTVEVETKRPAPGLPGRELPPWNADGSGQGNGQLENVTLRLHDLNRERLEIFKARWNVIDIKRRIANLQADVKAAKEDLKEAEAHFVRVVDGQVSGQKRLPLESEAAIPVEKPKPSPAPAPKPEPGPKPEPAATAPRIEPPPAGRQASAKDSNDISEIGFTSGQEKKLRAAGIESVWQYEQAHAKLPTIFENVKTRDRMHAVFAEYRETHPIDEFVPHQQTLGGMTEPDADAETAGTDLEEIEPEPTEFEEIPEDLSGDQPEDSDVTPIVEDLTGEEAQLGPEDAGEEIQESPEDDDDVDIEEMPGDEPEAPQRGRRKAGGGDSEAGRDVDPLELSDVLADLRVYVPGEVVNGWGPKVRRRIYDWAADCSDAADNPDGGDVPGQPAEIERWLRKEALQSGFVAWIRKQRE
jgi:hypothetical protein